MSRLSIEALDSLEPEERRTLYHMLKLRVLIGEDGEARAEMHIRPPARMEEEDPVVYRAGRTPWSVRTAGR